jgi:gas vesicle protein
MRQNRTVKDQPRRKFLAGLLAGIGGVAALLSASKHARAAEKKLTAPSTGPVLYRRSKESERYYKTLYQ